MKIRATVLLLAATTVMAQTVDSAPARDTPVRRVLAEAAGGEPKDAESLDGLVERIAPEKRFVAKTKLDELDRAELSPEALVDLDSACALLEGKTRFVNENGSPRGELIAAAAGRLEAGDYQAAVVLAEEALRLNPKNADALSILHSSKGRVAPSMLGTSPPPSGGGLAPANAASFSLDTRPLRPAAKLGVSLPVPGLKPNETEPNRPRSPWLPYAMAFGAGLVGIGVGLKNARDRASQAVDDGAEKIKSTGDKLADGAKEFIHENPKTLIALGVGAVALTAWLVLPAAGIGGGGLMLATAGGPSSAVAVTASGVTATKVAVVGAAAAAPLLMSGDSQSGQEPTAAEPDRIDPKVTFKTEHAGRHLEGTKVERSKVEQAIRDALEPLLKLRPSTGGHWGRVKVDGHVIEYRAYRVSQGQMNVGTYYPVK
ncbi:MAG: hypothetical protein Q8T11_05290 [Elusimicrobiota bacterium]|nr:hypothetical protein [Elusimicrobiota bacterium]